MNIFNSINTYDIIQIISMVLYLVAYMEEKEELKISLTLFMIAISLIYIVKRWIGC